MQTRTISSLRVLVLEPYYGGSHKIFLNELKQQLPLFEFVFLTLPARKWKWRMRMAAPWAAAKLPAQRHVDIILCSTFIDVSSLRGLAPPWVQDIPVLTYFHENQFAYPVQYKTSGDFHFGLTNYLSALASDSLAFNSNYNLGSFLQGCRAALKRAPDMEIDDVQLIADKSTILYPGMDFSESDALGEPVGQKVTTFVWNHRWEYDKNPEGFFAPFFKLKKKNIPFKLIIVGQSFQRFPDVFRRAKEELAAQLHHFGYVKDRQTYLGLLKKADVVVSTANHEFYGMAVIEAVRAGCRPLLPNRLSYPELFPAEYLYKSEADLYQKIRAFCVDRQQRIVPEQRLALTEQFSWQNLAKAYGDWFTQALANK